MQYMGSVSAAGLGVDSPPPTQFPASDTRSNNQGEGEGEDVHDYRADDEDEYDEEVDNSFDYVPPANYSVASESSEDFEGDGDTKEETAEEAAHEPESSVADEDEEKPSSPIQDESVDTVETVDVERRTVIKDTTVVKKYTRSVAATDEGKQDNKLMAVAVTSSSAVIDRVTSSTLGAAAANDLKDSSSSYLTTDSGDNESTPHASDADGVVADTAEEAKAENLLDPSDDKMDVDDDEEEKPDAVPNAETEDPAEAMEVDPEDEVVSETPQSGDTAREADDERSDAPDSQQSQPPATNAVTSSTSLKDPGPVPGPNVESKQPSTPSPKTKKKRAKRPAKSTKRKQRAASTTDPQVEDKGGDAGHESPTTTTAAAKAPTHTPKRPKRASAKKPRKSSPSAASEAGGSGDEQQSHLPPLRRSPRIKTETPKFTYPVKLLADEAVMNHFDRVSASGAASPSSTESMTCKYCGKHVTTSRGMATRHLNSCAAFERQEQMVSNLAEVDDSEEKPAAPLSPAAASAPDVKSEAALSSDAAATCLLEPLVLLMGTQTLANKLKRAYQRCPFTGHGPIARFQPLIRDDVTGLRHLRVQDLLDDTNGPIVQLRAKTHGAQRSTGQDLLKPVSKAKARNLEKLPLRFPAPRSVAEHFIAPLAKEMGLEYAMDEHTAHLVSCPQAGTLLDWRFHRTEAVVFQLGGKSLWKVKMGHVEHPLHCFHPESWQLDATAHVAKAHRVASMDKGTLGFLSPPGEDVHVFDEDEAGSVGQEEEEYMLKPGSVAYLPAGAWFETESQGRNSMWLEVQLASTTAQDLAFSALKQLAWGDKQWRMGLRLYPGDLNQTKSMRHHMMACMRSLYNEMAELEGSDLLPEYLCTEDMQDLVAQGLLQNVSRTASSTSFEVDLTNPRFKLKHEKVFKGAEYRVNPVAVLMSADEIPHLQSNDEEEATEEQPAGDGRASHHALKKTPKPKPKRKQALRVITHGGKHTYVLDEMFGNDALKSRLHVKFQCSADQSKMVEWLRGRDAEPFDLEEFVHCDLSVLRTKSPARCEENARLLLRFLCFVGYVTQVKKHAA